MKDIKELIVRKIDRLVSKCNDNKESYVIGKIDKVRYMKIRGIIINNYTESILKEIKQILRDEIGTGDKINHCEEF